MSTLADLSYLISNELLVIKISFSKFIYEIKDEQHSYALISASDKAIRTLKNQWTFEKDLSWQGKFSKILIKNNKSNVVGFFTFSIGSKNLLLVMNNGFKAELIRKRYPLLFKSDFTWQHDKKDIMTLKESTWSGEKPLKVILLSSLNQTPELEIMLLYGVAFSIDNRFEYANLPLGYN
ncbi:hypothetical protein NAF17_07105 [Mucilaginibacter sp. RB4R14]|uniref:hypothetical protein n=1 Tax=Mucilaginibacter aurantiaciroseus TaxID=2949308 RepID=UPI0020919545|nr:hypothetical protein [Mucilaginibacter aurantiaciroseus]MCO5935302.1 hypothetical protein [Mucilaginibacter aurantiaciroseus]